MSRPHDILEGRQDDVCLRHSRVGVTKERPGVQCILWDTVVIHEIALVHCVQTAPGCTRRQARVEVGSLTSMHLWASRPEVSLVCMLYRREERPQHLYWPKRQWDAQWVAVESGPATLLPPLSHGSYDTGENICTHIHTYTLRRQFSHHCASSQVLRKTELS